MIVPDLIGSDFGCSSSVRGRGDGDEVPFRNDIKSHTSSLVKLVDALGLGSVDLLGHSFGGFLAQVTTMRLLVMLPFAFEFI